MLNTLPAPPRRPPDDEPGQVDEPGGGHAGAPVTASWTAGRLPVRVTVTDITALPAARRVVERQLDAVHRAAGRDRRDAEIHKLYGAAGRPVRVSPLLAELVSVALGAAARTGGDVDPTVAAAVTAQRAARHGLRTVTFPACGGSPSRPSRPAAGWQRVRLDGRRLQVPAGVTLDLTATAKAFAADRSAALVADLTGSGVLVRLGHDVATAGPAPAGGWAVELPGAAGPGSGCTATLPAGAALATSRADVPAGDQPSWVLHQVLDPRTGLPPVPVWRLASVLAFSCVEANAYATAALVRGTAASAWLRQLWVSARLVTAAGDVVTAGPWPADPREWSGGR